LFLLYFNAFRTHHITGIRKVSFSSSLITERLLLLLLQQYILLSEVGVSIWWSPYRHGVVIIKASCSLVEGFLLALSAIHLVECLGEVFTDILGSSILLFYSQQ
jgi:hypothetical protein